MGSDSSPGNTVVGLPCHEVGKSSAKTSTGSTKIEESAFKCIPISATETAIVGGGGLWGMEGPGAQQGGNRITT